MKKVIVTGGSGFIGSNLIKFLIKNNYFVINIDKNTYSKNSYILKNINKKKYIFHKLDINNKKEVLKILRKNKPSAIFNLAAETHVDRSIDSPNQFIHSNIYGVFNLLEAIREYSRKIKLIHISTDEVYGDLTNGLFDESSQMKPSNPYAASKAMADLLIQAYSRTYGIDYIIARPSNNYGYHQYPEKLIPLAVKRLSRGKKIKLHDEGKPTRTWTHSEDTADAIMTLYDKADRNSIYNISSEYEQTNLETVNKILSAYFMGNLKRKVPDANQFLDFSYNRPGQDIRYAISCAPLKNLGWSPQRDFDKELVELVQHYKKEFRW